MDTTQWVVGVLAEVQQIAWVIVFWNPVKYEAKTRVEILEADGGTTEPDFVEAAAHIVVEAADA